MEKREWHLEEKGKIRKFWHAAPRIQESMSDSYWIGWREKNLIDFGELRCWCWRFEKYRSEIVHFSRVEENSRFEPFQNIRQLDTDNKSIWVKTSTTWQIFISNDSRFLWHNQSTRFLNVFEQANTVLSLFTVQRHDFQSLKRVLSIFWSMFDEGHLSIRSNDFSRGVGVISIDKQNTYTHTLKFNTCHSWLNFLGLIYIFNCSSVNLKRLFTGWLIRWNRSFELIFFNLKT